MARLVYAGFQLADIGGANLTWGRELQADAAGRPVGYSVRVDVNNASVQCLGAADAAAKMATIQQVLDIYGGDLSFDAGRAVLSSRTLGGVRCVYGPVWLPERGGSGVTFISFSCGFQWEYLRTDAENLVDFSEQITVTGGEPVRVLRDIINQPKPIVQQTVPLRGWRCTQTGRAVGLRKVPTPPLPTYPAALTNKSFARSSSRRAGPFPYSYRDFPVEWTYEFVSAIPLLAIPNEWVD